MFIINLYSLQNIFHTNKYGYMYICEEIWPSEIQVKKEGLFKLNHTDLTRWFYNQYVYLPLKPTSIPLHFLKSHNNHLPRFPDFCDSILFFLNWLFLDVFFQIFFGKSPASLLCLNEFQEHKTQRYNAP